MENWFECKITYDKDESAGTQPDTNAKGLNKAPKITENYLVNEINYASAERRIVNEEANKKEKQINFLVKNIKRVNYYEMILDEPGDRYYKAKILTSMVEKKGAVTILVHAYNIGETVNIIEKQFSDVVIISVADALILDVYPYDPSVIVGRRPND
ncbi:MAG: DUF4494 domain-containing protein [Tannerella sp.]|jgi:NCAIR mutase (PurE)-related protein|nr:DUF4494 domain-containing protein [Tannerella sp.]